MDIAALIAWLLTAAGGFFLLGTWVAKGGHRRNSHLPPALIFGHFALAVAGLIVWIIYLVTDNNALGWAAFIVLIPVALLGLGMLARWIPTYRARTPAPPAGGGTTAAATVAEKHFPVALVGGHGLLAVVTLVLVLLTDLGIGGS
jgi:manganese efflux pump family protein